MSNSLALREESRALALESGIVETSGRFAVSSAPAGDSMILIHLGPDQSPETVRILRSAWPTATALNFAEGREFHMRLRRHSASGIFIVYGSVSKTSKNHDRPSIFGDVIQRGRLCRNLQQVELAIPYLRQQLGLPATGKLNP